MRWVAGMVRLQVELERERVWRNHQHSPAVDRDLDSRHTALQQVRPATASVCLSVCLSVSTPLHLSVTIRRSIEAEWIELDFSPRGLSYRALQGNLYVFKISVFSLGTLPQNSPIQ